MTNLETFQLIYKNLFGAEHPNPQNITYQHFLYKLEHSASESDYKLDFWDNLLNYKSTNPEQILFCFKHSQELENKRYFFSFDFNSPHTYDNHLSENFQVHSLKITPEYFEDVEALEKTFEVRLNDRNFKVGDVVELNEFRDNIYTGSRIYKLITYILNDSNYVKEGYVIFSIDDF